PINMAKALVPQLRDKGRVAHGYLGVQLQDIDANLAKSMNLPADAKGALVAQVVPGSPADKAGLQEGDLVTSFDGKPVSSADDLVWLTGSAGAGKAVWMAVVGPKGKRNAQVALIERPDEKTLAGAGGGGDKEGATAPSLGLRVASVTPDLARQLNVTRPGGVVITDVAQDSPAVNLQPGDVIFQVNGH